MSGIKTFLAAGPGVAICTQACQLWAGDCEDRPLVPRHWLRAVLQQSGFPLHLQQFCPWFPVGALRPPQGAHRAPASAPVEGPSRLWEPGEKSGTTSWRREPSCGAAEGKLQAGRAGALRADRSPKMKGLHPRPGPAPWLPWIPQTCSASLPLASATGAWPWDSPGSWAPAPPFPALPMQCAPGPSLCTGGHQDPDGVRTALHWPAEEVPRPGGPEVGWHQLRGKTRGNQTTPPSAAWGQSLGE